MPKGVYPRKPRILKMWPADLVNRVERLYSSGLTQEEVGAEIGVSQKTVYKMMARHGLTARPAAKRDQSGPRNHMWKGDAASYQALHCRLYSRFGKASHCSVCGTRSARAFDYANLTGNYTDLSDYAPMCRSCHHKFDGRAANFTRKEGCRGQA